MAQRNWGLRVLNDGMNLSRDKEDLFDELVVGVVCQPHIDELLWHWLNKLGDLQLTELFLFHHHVSLRCLGRLTKGIGIRGLVGHVPEFFPGLNGFECHRIMGIRRLFDLLMLEFFLSSHLDYCFDEAKALNKIQLMDPIFI